MLKNHEIHVYLNVRDCVLMHSVKLRIIIIDRRSSIVQTLKVPHCPTPSRHTSFVDRYQTWCKNLIRLTITPVSLYHYPFSSALTLSVGDRNSNLA